MKGQHRLESSLMEEKSATRICVPVCVKQSSEIAPAIARAADVADIIELRIDCLTEAEFKGVEHELSSLFRECSRPIIFTFRPAEQGGQRKLDKTTRERFWLSQIVSLLTGNGNYADLETDVALCLEESEVQIPQTAWDRIICSHHDFVGGPADLEEIYERMAATKARVIKIAVLANDITDCIPVLNLLKRARNEDREMIAIAMGDAGIMTRILAPSRGAFLTYGSIEKSQAIAPGQLTVTELRDLYRIDDIDQETEIMGLVGEHVMHSVSPHLHNVSFAACGLNAVYIPFEVRGLDEFMRCMVDPRTREIDWNLRGLSVTSPYKGAIMKHLDWIDACAVEIGAVNTVVISADGLRGYNTDASAVLAPLDGMIDLSGARVAVIGAGGAARALLWSLHRAGAHVTVFARDAKRGPVTADQFGAGFSNLEGAAFGEFEMVVNTTPLGTVGLNDKATPAIASQLFGVRIAYDLVYNPLETRFMLEAREAGCQRIGGLQMLVGQAVEQFKFWTGIDAPVSDMHKAALDALRK